MDFDRYCPRFFRDKCDRLTISTGSDCSSRVALPSHVLRASNPW
ncbi:MAG: hypothetical protein ACRC80_08875 [Waterburya sp.]